MNLTRLKTYAPDARAALITAVTRRAGTLGIQPGRVEAVSESGNVALIGGQPFPRSIVPLRKQLLDLIQRDGFDHTMEAMAYTWFNRLVALRFMELHDGYLDHGYRVLSHPQGTPLPEILQHAEHVSLKGLDREEVIRLKLDGNRDEELYRLLLLAQCAELNVILPDVFSKLDDATILLLPDNLLHSDSVIRQLIAGSDAEDWQQVEVLGWLYQFYISEKKDAVMARKSAVPTEDIPAVTQLFTPHWIVRYLVENSLGKLWLLNRPGSRLREHMPYYIEGEPETDFLKITKPEDIKLLDPAVGSGHMLTYAFDLLVHIYEEEGYAANDIPGLILKHNLHGTEICPRAAQLAELALVFKAREKSRRFFQPEHLVRPRIIELRDVRFDEGELSDYFKALGVQPSAISPKLLKLLPQFEEAKNFGSLIQPCMSESEIQSAFSSLHNSSFILHNSDLMVGATHIKVLRVLEQAEALTQRYHVVVANPPYMGNGAMNAPLLSYVKERFPESKTDLGVVFIDRTLTMTLTGGKLAMVTQHTWLFLGSYDDFRARLLASTHIVTALHLGPRAFPEISGEVVQSVAFVIRNIRQELRSHFVRLVDLPTTEEKERNLRNAERTFSVSQRNFSQLPGHIFGYWLSEQIVKVFSTEKIINDFGHARRGLQTGCSPRFIRFWHETEVGKTLMADLPRSECIKTDKRWFLFNNGGDFRKWYGNVDYVVNWESNGEEIKATGKAIIPSEHRYFEEGVTWSRLGGGRTAFRLLRQGIIPGDTGPTIFTDGDRRVMLGYLNTTVCESFLKVLVPSMTFLTGDIENLPFKSFPAEVTDAVHSVANECVSLAAADWDNFETSWDFRDQPLLRPGLKGATLEASWRNWEAQSTAAIRRMQELETENNRLFIAAYGLDGELQPEVPEAQITLARADARRDMAAFLSYAVGCMMGRYSLDAGGLILANAGDTVEDYVERIAALRNSTFSIQNSTFHPDTDAIIPVLDGEWFEDDIVTRTKEFLRATFGEATLSANIAFIEAALGKDLRTYFLNDFYKDHLQTYKNRPIYWQLSSGKQKAFQCLVYLHRYTPGTLARIRTEYAIPLQGKLSGRITRLEEGVANASSSAARKKLQTELDQCKKQIVELLAFDEQLRSHADQRITLDLDDGVKANYAKFGPLLAEAKKVCGTKDD
jgi:hypothetical protein